MSFYFKKEFLYDEKNHYTEIANMIFILIYKKWKARGFPNKFIISVYKEIFQNKEISVGCVKTKVSQLRKYENTGDTFNISANLIELFNAVRNIDYNKLQNNLEQVSYGAYVNFYKLN